MEKHCIESRGHVLAGVIGCGGVFGKVYDCRRCIFHVSLIFSHDDGQRHAIKVTSLPEGEDEKAILNTVNALKTLKSSSLVPYEDVWFEEVSHVSLIVPSG